MQAREEIDVLSKRQNLLETIHGGNPDRFVKQFEAFALFRSNPFALTNPRPEKGAGPVKNAWGVTNEWPEGTPGSFPIHDEEHLVCPDITRWREYVHAPSLEFTDEDWQPFVDEADAVDREEQFVTAFVAPGIFEQCHHLTKIDNCLLNLVIHPDEMHELIDYLTDWEIELARQLCHYLKPDALFHHDDWGSQISTLMSKEMFDEFLLPSYQRIYGFYHDHGVELVVHHSDSYAATLVPEMIEAGVNIWQGVMTTNDVPKLIEEYGERISFMGDIDTGKVDNVDWTEENIMDNVRTACESCGKLYFIPNATQGGAYSTFPGVYECIDACIDIMSKEMF